MLELPRTLFCAVRLKFAFSLHQRQTLVFQLSKVYTRIRYEVFFGTSTSTSSGSCCCSFPPGNLHFHSNALCITARRLPVLLETCCNGNSHFRGGNLFDRLCTYAFACVVMEICLAPCASITFQPPCKYSAICIAVTA